MLTAIVWLSAFLLQSAYVSINRVYHEKLLTVDRTVDKLITFLILVAIATLLTIKVNS